MDIVCLSYDGNLADAALIAAMGALMRLQLPGTRRVDDEIFLTEGEEGSATHVCAWSYLRNSEGFSVVFQVVDNANGAQSVTDELQGLQRSSDYQYQSSGLSQ